jgi:Fe-S-cluster containining protein
MQDLHDAEFKKTDCLKCNCCKTTGPLFTDADIERVSKYLRQNHNSLLSNIFKSMKTEIMCCKASRVLSDNENACMIYDVRPKACREFPHTDRKVSTDH